jgi:hypothetical protein
MVNAQSGAQGRAKRFWSMMVSASMLVSLFFPIAGLIWYFFSLEGRISTLELRIKVLDEAQKAQPVSAPTADTSPPHAAPSNDSPIVRRCNLLYDKRSTAIDKGESVARQLVEDDIKSLNCPEALKTAK